MGIRKHEPLRVPQGWEGQARALVVQLERILNDVYGHMHNDDAWRTVYPVDSIYISDSDTSPAELFGGAWEAVTNSLNLHMWKRTA